MAIDDREQEGCGTTPDRDENENRGTLTTQGQNEENIIYT